MVNKNSQLGDSETKQIIRGCQMNEKQQESEKEASRNHGQGLQLNQTDHLHLNQQTNEESLKHIEGLEKQLDEVKTEVSESKEIMLDMKHQFSKLESAQTGKQEQGSEIAEKGNKNKELEHIKNTFIMAKESNNNLNPEISEHKVKCNKQGAEMEVHKLSQGDKLEIIDKLRLENVELQSKNAELDNIVLHLTGELLRLHKENQDLETQLTDCSKSLASKCKLNGKGFQSSCNSSAENDIVVKAFMSGADHDSEEIPIVQEELEIIAADLKTQSSDETK